MTRLMRATRLVAASAAFGLSGLSVAAAQNQGRITATVTGPSLVRPHFTRPGGIPGSARVLAANQQYLLAPAQPSDSATPKKLKRR